MTEAQVSWYSASTLYPKGIIIIPSSKPVGTRHPSWPNHIRNVLVISDALAITAALVTTLYIRMPDPDAPLAGARCVTYPTLALVLGSAWLVILSTNGSHRIRLVGSGLQQYQLVMRGTLWIFGVLAVLSYLFKLSVSRSLFLIALPLGLIFMCLERKVIRKVIQRSRKQGRFLIPTLVTGAGPEVERTVQTLRRNIAVGYAPAAVCLNGEEPQKCSDLPADLPVLGYQQLLKEVREFPLSAVVAAGGMSSAQTKQLSWDLEDCRTQLLFIPELIDVAGPRMSTYEAAGLNLVHVDLAKYSGIKYIIKRAFDILASLMALILFSPTMAVTALAIRLEDGGPAIFKQERIGENGKPFTIHKFRSMAVDAEARMAELIAANGGCALLFKMEDDPRITKVGRFIRKYSIDELPQFWTVLRGSMSIVGPRPQVQREVDEYEEPTHRRLLVKPGITGLWQIGGRSDLPLEEAVRLDLKYVENWSLLGDISIILKTVKVVLFPNGAY